MLAAMEDVEQHGALPVPLHLRNAPTRLMKKLGYGKDYQYAHNFPDHVIDQQHLPNELKTHKYYVPSDSGYEKQIKERLASWQQKKTSRS
jgi:putative ATPase